MDNKTYYAKCEVLFGKSWKRIQRGTDYLIFIEADRKCEAAMASLLRKETPAAKTRYLLAHEVANEARRRDQEGYAAIRARVDAMLAAPDPEPAEIQIAAE